MTKKILYADSAKEEYIMNYDHLKLDNQLCFALYACSKEIIKKYKPLLDPLGLTYTGYITLLALWEKDNITVKTLGERLYLDSGTMTPLLKKLESQGYVTRTRGTDERTVYICLTEQGKELQKAAADIPGEMVCSSKLDIEKAPQLLFELHDILKRMTK